MSNRELKFRVWGVKDKKFLNPSDIAINGNGNLLITDSGWYENFENQNLSDYVVQQYTGFLDKNGYEIYEGHTIKCEKPEIWLKEEFVQIKSGIVIFRYGSFCVQESTTEQLIDYQSATNPEQLICEIIGNAS
jgi:uncharacterized phage protein (TIGR01671 family)